MPKISLTPVSLAHTSVLAALHEICFDNAWDEKAFQEMLTMPGMLGFLISSSDEGEEPSGFLLIQASGSEAEILTLGVVPTLRGQGLAQALLHSALEELRELKCEVLFLEVAENNHAALNFYQLQGFEEVGRRKAYYKQSDGRCDALILRFDLTQKPL